MPRRRELRAVANGLAGSFAGRNNDTDGYWTLGKLYEHAMRESEVQVIIDLITASLTPPDASLLRVALAFRRRLFEQMFSKRIPAAWVTLGVITVQFSPPSGLSARPFVCEVTIEDDRGRRHMAIVRGECWPHDPAREMRSARALWPDAASKPQTLH